MLSDTNDQLVDPPALLRARTTRELLSHRTQTVNENHDAIQSEPRRGLPPWSFELDKLTNDLIFNLLQMTQHSRLRLPWIVALDGSHDFTMSLIGQ